MMRFSWITQGNAAGRTVVPIASRGASALLELLSRQLARLLHPRLKLLFSTTSGMAARIAARIRASVSPRQPPSSAILASMSSEKDAPLEPSFVM